MKIHEYQAKEILRKYGVPVPKGRPAFSIGEAEAAAKELIAETGNEVVVVKAQIHAGGRGKGGGVKVVKGAARRRATPRKKILGMTLVTPPDRPGRPAGQAPADRAGRRHRPRALPRHASSTAAAGGGGDGLVRGRHGDRGGRRQAPGEDPQGAGRPGGRPGRLPGAQPGLRPGPARRRGQERAPSCSCCACTRRSSRSTPRWWRSTRWWSPNEGKVLALDCKMTFDDNALYRHQELEELRDLDEEDPAETEAKRYDLSFIKLDGNIGCMVNGAGLAMATMDIIKHFGGRAGELPRRRRRRHHEKVTAAFKIITADPTVKRHLRQHLRRHHEVRHHRRRRHRGGQAGRAQGAAGGAAGRHQRRAGQEAAGRIGPGGHHRQRHGRRRQEDRRPGRRRAGEGTKASNDHPRRTRTPS